MGYILPITHYDYKQYQNRMREVEERPHYINRPYKAVFHRISPEYERNTPANLFDKQSRMEEKQEMYHDFFHITKLKKAQLTGKGGMINEQT